MRNFNFCVPNRKPKWHTPVRLSIHSPPPRFKFTSHSSVIGWNSIFAIPSNRLVGDDADMGYFKFQTDLTLGFDKRFAANI